MRVTKHGKVVDIPVRRGTIARTREAGSGVVTKSKVIVVGAAPATSYSRAYGRQVYVCHFFGGSTGAVVSTQAANDLYPIGKAKRIPIVCKEALAEFAERYPTLAPRKRRR